MENPLYALGFLSLFHIIGGAAVGWSIRQLLARQFGCNNLFLIVWGTLFGFAPLCVGSGILLESTAPYLFVVEVAVLIGTLVVAALAPLQYFDALNSQNVFMMGFGGFFFLVGMAMFIENWREGLLSALVPGGLGMLLGGAAIAIAINDARKELT